MALADDFKKAADEVKQLKQRPSNDQLLKLYSLFKQGTEGDVDGKRPGMLQIKERAKFDAWAELKGKAKDACQKDYVQLVSDLKKA